MVGDYKPFLKSTTSFYSERCEFSNQVCEFNEKRRRRRRKGKGGRGRRGREQEKQQQQSA